MNEKNLNPMLNLIEKAEVGGLNYIQREQSYISRSVLFPIYSLFILIVNIVYFVINPFKPEPELPLQEVLENILRVILPISIFVVISIFSLIQYIFLKKWRNKVEKYHSVLDLKNTLKKDEFIQEEITLTNLFYDIVNHMEKLKLLIIVMSIMSISYLWSSFRISLVNILLFIEDITFISILDLSGSFALVIFLMYIWYHFLHWNKKLKTIRNYEKRIIKELGL